MIESIVDREAQSLGVPGRPADVQAASEIVPVQYQQAPTGGAASAGQPQQSEVQRQLQMLYEQDGRPMPQMQVPTFSPEAQQYAPVSSRRSRPWDVLNPLQWKRKFDQSRRQSQPPRQTPAEQFQPGQAAPLPQMTPPPDAPLAFPQHGTPQPAPQYAEQPLPRLQRVSPEIFAPPAADASPFAHQPAPFPGAADSAQPALSDAAVPADDGSGKPLLIILPEAPGQFEVPPAQGAPFAAPVADGLPTWAQPQSESDTARNQPLPSLENTLGGPAPDPLADPFPDDSNADAAQGTGPYTGLQLEPDPYAEPLSAPSSASSAGPLIVPGAAAGGAPSLPDFQSPALYDPTGLQPPGELPQVVPQQPLPVPQQTAPARAEPYQSSDVKSKMERIASREGLRGFKGFCPVVLRDMRELADAKLEHSAVYQGSQYWFSSAEARQAFLANPGAYVPASNGIDVVLFQKTGRQEIGSLDYAVWYRSKLFLFTSDATKAVFVSSPRTHALDK
jgi:YHS domain-containing protein